MMDNDVCGMGAAAPYDYRKYDRIWERVAPSLSPYPLEGYGSGDADPKPMQGAMATPAAMPGGSGLLAEPGAQADPCCMGTAAAELLDVLTGFVEEELADCRHYTAFARQAPPAARQILRRLAAEEAEHARRLMAAYYLITGKCYQPHISCDRVYIGPYCPALRERYHAEACGGFNYIRAADSTTDPCLIKLLTELSEQEYCHANVVMALLEKALGNR